MTDWQPIEIEPEDGATVLAFWIPMADERVTERHYGIALFERGRWCNYEDHDEEYGSPDFWRVLPPAPTTVAQPVNTDSVPGGTPT